MNCTPDGVADGLERTGYDVSLCEELKDDGFLCPFCNLLMRTPVQTYRGELACQYCYNQAKREDSAVCPIDGEPINEGEVFLDKHKCQAILALECYCCNKKDGCEWKGVVGEVEEHEESCEYKSLQCYLCKRVINLSTITSHMELCDKLPAKGKCIFTQCMFTYTTIAELKNHLESDIIQHVFLDRSTLSNMQDQFNNQLVAHEANSKEKEKKLDTKIKQLEKQCTSLTQNFSNLQATCNTTMNNHEKSLQALEKARLSQENKQSSSTASDNNTSAHLANSIKVLTQKIADVTLKQQVHEYATFDGRSIWRIDDVAKRLNQAVTGKVAALHSAPTFTERYGYKFCGRLYLNGDGVGRCTHVSMFFVLMKSEYDNLLTWPFSKRITMRMINQLDGTEDVVERFDADVNSSSFMRPRKEMNVASGCPLFVSRERFLNGGFIKDDTMFVELNVSDATAGAPVEE